jgi:RNA 3'-terminal phosphate cyclase (ATP)
MSAEIVEPRVINGTFGEGGAALMRTALAAASLTQQPVRIHHVRGATRKPGITSEDLTFVHALEVITQAKLAGADLRSDDLTFIPTRGPKSIVTRMDIQEHEKGTQPGNALVLASSLLPVLARAGGYSKLLIHGETYNPNTLTFDVFERGTLRALARMGLVAFARQEVAGFGFGGHGEVTVEIEPSVPNAIQWGDRGSLRTIEVVVVTGELPETIADRGANYAAARFHEMGLPVEVDAVTVSSRTPGAYVTIVGEFERGFGTGTAIGAKGVRIERVVDQAIEQFLEWYQTSATVDPFLADHLLLPAVLCEEPSLFTVSRVTPRLLTMAWVIKQFFPIHLTILGIEGEPGTVRISR